MKKSELKVGEEYAIGSTSRYDRFPASRVKVLDLNKGVLVEFVEDGHGYPYSSKKVGDRIVVTGREVRQPWSEYAEARAAFQERQRAHEAEQKRIRALVEDVIVKLRLKGYDADTSAYSHAPIRWTGKTFSVDVSEMVKIAEALK